MPLKLSILILLCIHTSFWSCSEDSQNISETEKIKDNKKNEQKKKITSGFSDDLSSFIPKNYAILDTASGDLNLDAVEDKIVVLNKIGEDTLSDVVDNIIIIYVLKNATICTCLNDNPPPPPPVAVIETFHVDCSTLKSQVDLSKWTDITKVMLC